MNKCLNVIGILLVLLLFPYCGKRDARQMDGQGNSAHAALAEIDSLMWRQADSAFVLLQEFVVSPEVEELDTFDGHYCQLLISELLYKNDCEQTNRTDLLHAVTYFDSLTFILNDTPHSFWSHCGLDPQSPELNDKISFLAARAHYINGVGYYELGNVVQACAEYLKALELVESHFEEKDMIGHKARFMVYTYNRLGELYKEQLLTEPAIDCYKQALYYCKRETTSIYGIPLVLYNLGIQFDIAGSKDSAAFYYDKAIAVLPDKNNTHYRDILTNKILLEYNTGLCFDSVFKELEYVVSLASDEEEKTTRYLTIGNVLFEEKHYDSARFYLETVFEQQEDIQSKILAAENLCDIYQIKGDSVKAHQYAFFLADYTMAEIEKKTEVSKINEMFKNHVKQKQEIQAEKERKKAVRKIIGIILPIAIMIILTIIVFAKLKGKQQLRDKEKKHQQELESERQTHRMQQAALSGRLKRSNEELRYVSKRLEQSLSRNDFSSDVFDDYEAFLNAPVCRYIVELVHKQQFKSKMDFLIYKDAALRKEQILALRDAAENHLSRFVSYIRVQFPKLTDNDMDYCYLFLLGLNEADISALMQRAYTTVCDRSRKINRIIGANDNIFHTLHGMLDN